MNLAAVIPVKALGAAKSRLASALDDGERGALALWLAGRTLDAVADSGAAARVAVVSPDRAVLAWAAARGVAPLAQRAGDLNDGLALGRRWAAGWGADALLVLLGDLPRLGAGDVRALAALAAEGAARAAAAGGAGAGVLAPDRAGKGTNALLLAPPDCLPFAFGAGSRARHEELARVGGVTLATYAAPGTAFDVDRPADLEELRKAGLWPRADAVPPRAARRA